ncbi:MAG: folate-binding protein YgfZ [Gallionella sp.]|nr:folate-binding protein YgfZ [Gallionella sp.]
MNPEWQDFLTRHHAHIDAGVVQHFGDRDAELGTTAHSTVLCDLSQFGTLRVSGEDAQSFLQNLLSNDFRNVDGTHAQLSSFNTAKGRMLVVFTIWREGDDYLLQLPVTLVEAMRKKLSLYVMRAKVKLNDTSHEQVSLGVAGVRAEAILRDLLGGDLPQENLACLATGPVHVLKINNTRYQLNVTPQHAEKLWAAINKDAPAVGSVCWDWLNIRAGIPVIEPKTQEEFVPQMANLDALGGINFKKGCYPGQEIVARMHYLGKLKRRMYLAHLACDAVPQAGEELFSADMAGQASGMIANAAPAPNGGYDILAVIQTASAESTTVHTASGVALAFLTLPYTIG